eukprot:scaffold59157_cov60-Phaeocystis_antarctica.AAC.1
MPGTASARHAGDEMPVRTLRGVCCLLVRFRWEHLEEQLPPGVTLQRGLRGFTDHPNFLVARAKKCVLSGGVGAVFRSWAEAEIINLPALLTSPLSIPLLISPAPHAARATADPRPSASPAWPRWHERYPRGSSARSPHGHAAGRG